MNTLIEGKSAVMKFVINGRAYDTESSTVAAIYRGSATPATSARDLPPDAQSIRFEHVLYRTERGNFFLHSHETIKYAHGKPVVEDRAEAYTPEVAVQWIAATNAMII